MRRSWLGQGIIAGLVGATCVALWFLIADLIVGHPLYTPRVLGEGVFSVFGPLHGASSATLIFAYTIFHYAAFIVVGIIASAIVNFADRQPTVLAGAMILFVVFEAGFYFLSTALAQNMLVGHSAWLVAIGNLIAAVAMGAYLWHEHPSLGRELRYALDGKE